MLCLIIVETCALFDYCGDLYIDYCGNLCFVQ